MLIFQVFLTQSHTKFVEQYKKLIYLLCVIFISINII
jgi:hypothetical protein